MARRLPVSFRLGLIALLAWASLSSVAARTPVPSLAFEANLGQTDAQVDFLARGPGYGIWLQSQAATFALQSPQQPPDAANRRVERPEAALRMALLGARTVAGIGEAQLPGASHYLSIDGSTPPVTDVPRYARVRYPAVYPGIDLVYYGRDGHLEYDFVLAPGATPARIALKLEGQRAARIDDEGRLVLDTTVGEMIQQAPFAFQWIDGVQQRVEANFVLDGDLLAFDVGDYDRELPLTIDPIFAYASYIGGSAEDRASDVTVNAAGEAYITGVTRSTNFPMVNAIQPTKGAGSDAFLVKLSADGSTALISTYLGGAHDEQGSAIALDGDSNILIAGHMYTGEENYNVFELKLSAAGNQLVYTRTLSGLPEWDRAHDIATDSAGNAYIVGETSSSNFPLVNHIQGYTGGTKGFLRKLAPNGNVLVSTYIGTSSNHVDTRGVALDSSGNVYLTGLTRNIQPAGQIYVLKLNSSLSAVGYSKQFGGSNEDAGEAIAVLGNGTVYVAGTSQSADFPVVGGHKNTLTGNSDMVLLRIDTAGTLTASTYFGGEFSDRASGIALGPDGQVHVAGTRSRLYDNYGDVSAARFSATLASLTGYAEYGFHTGLPYHNGTGIAVDGSGRAYVTSSSSGSLPITAGAWRASNPGDQNGHIAKIVWDTHAALSINDRSRLEGHTGTTNFDFYVSLNQPSAGPVAVNYATANGTAIAGQDYTAASGSLTFQAGMLGQSLNIAVLGDRVLEADETFFVNLSGISGATLADNQGKGTIQNDDQANGNLRFTASSASVAENAGSIVLSVERVSGSWGDVNVNYATANGTAVAGSDYVATSGSLNWAHNDSTNRSIEVPISDDLHDENNETFTLSLSQPGGGATLGTPSAVTVTITDDDPAPTLSVDNGGCNVTEGNTGSVNCSFVLRLSAVSGKTVTFNTATANGTAIAGSDYTGHSSTARSIAAGQTTLTVNVPVLGDTLHEGNETFSLNVTSIANATPSSLTATGTIIDNDPAPTLSVDNGGCSVTEGNTGSINCNFVYWLSTVSGRATTFNTATANGTAIAGQDYTGHGSTARSIAAGQTTLTVAVPVLGDVLHEATETFSLNATSVVGASPTSLSATGTILDNDAAPTLSVDNGGCSVTEGNSGSVNCGFVFRLSAASGRTTTFNTATANGTATAGSDYTGHSSTARSIAAGQTTLTVAVPVLGDLLHEATETFNLNATSIVGASPSSLSATGTILDNDAAPTLAVDNGGCSVTEGNSGSVNCNFVFRLSAASGRATTFNTATANGTATAGSDYTGHSSTARSIAAGQTTLTVAVPVLGDLVHEDTETFSLNASSITGASPTSLSATGTILDNDSAPVLSVDNGGCSATEGNSGSVNCGFVLRLSAASGTTVTFSTATANGTATAGSDYTGHAATARSIAAGQTTLTVNVPVLGDTLHEGNETFTLNVTGVAHATPSSLSATGTIVDDDAAPTLSVDNGGCSVTEGHSGSTNCSFVLRLSAASGKPVSFSTATANGSATAGSDYTGHAATARSIAAGQTTLTVNVPVLGDTLNEGDETFTLNVTGVTNATPSSLSATGTIIDDDGLPVLSVDNGGCSVSEGNSGSSNCAFVLRLSAASGTTVTFSTATANGTATAGSDYTGHAATARSIAAGQTTLTVNVPVLGDTLHEGNETFTLNVTGVTNATPSSLSATGTIVDDDAAPTLSVDNGGCTVTEGNAGSTNCGFVLRLSAVSGKPVSFSTATANGTATAGSDYTGHAATARSIPAGQTTLTVNVPVLGDTLNEGDETFTLNVTGVANATPSSLSATGTIIDDDGLPVLSIDNGGCSVSEGNSGSSNCAFVLRLSVASSQTVTFSTATANGTATAGSDYTGHAATARSIAAGQTTLTVNVPVLGDTLHEGNETFTLNVTGVTNATPTSLSATGTIVDDDTAPVLSVDNGGCSVTEGHSGSTTCGFVLRLSAVSGKPVTFSTATTNGTATAGSDYTGHAATARSIAAGQTTLTVNVPVLGDTLHEGNETFTLNVTGVANATPTSLSATGTIVDDDAAPILSVDNGGCSITEGNSGSINCSFVLRLSAVSGKAVTFSTATTNGTATAGSDYTGHAATARSIPAGQTTLTVDVPVLGDTLNEGDETFTLNVTGVANATPGSLSATGTIIDDDGPPVLSVDAGGCSVNEGHSGSTHCSFVLRLSAPSAMAVSFSTATANGTATAGSDYSGHAATARSIPAGQTTLTVNVPVLGDTLHEDDESFTLHVTAVANATPGALSATGTIVDDDDAPTLGVDNGGCSVTEGNSGSTNCSFVLRLSAVSGKTVSFSTATANGTATAGSDYTGHAATARSIVAGQTMLTVNVPVLGDTLHEGNETFTLNVTGVTHATPGAFAATGTIIDDDGAELPALSIDDTQVTEGDGGTVAAVFTVRLSSAASDTVSVDWATADGSATAPADYSTASGRLSFSPGQLSRSISVAVVGDLLDEFDETFRVQLSAASGANILRGEAQATIIDNDAAPGVAIDDCAVLEGHAGSTPCVVRLRLGAVSGRPVTLDWALAFSLPPQLQSSFESPVVSTAQRYASGTVVDGWRVQSGNVDLVRADWHPAAGEQSLSLNGSAPAIIDRDLPTSAGQRYRITLALAAHPDCNNVAHSIALFWDGIAAGTATVLPDTSITSARLNRYALDWQPIELDDSFLASAASTRLTIGSLSGGDCGPVLDSVTVVREGLAVPAIDTMEDSTGSMVIPAGQTVSGPIAVEIRGDRIVETDEVLAVTIAGGSGYSTVSNGKATIYNDDSGSPTRVFGDGFE
jgi:hypothetical protein